MAIRPEEIYHHPASAYVGGFIGSPAMNFLSGQITSGSVLLANGGRIPLPPDLAASHDGQLTQIGLRPEDLTLVPAGMGNLDALFEFSEELGAARLYHFQFEDLTLSVLSADKPLVERGKPCGIRIGSGAVHLFAADTGRRLVARHPARERAMA